MKNLWNKNKVLIMGLLSAVAMSVYQFTDGRTVDWVLVGYTAVVAAGSFLANNLRGQWASIAGLILPAAAVVYNDHITGGHINFGVVFMALAVKMLAVISPPPKSLAYEKSPVIELAKSQADQGITTTYPPPTTIPPPIPTIATTAKTSFPQ